MQRNLPHTIGRHAEGATAVEYALILPVLLLLIMGVIEYSLVIYASATLEGAVTIAAREGKTGYTTANVSQQTYIYGIVQNKVAGLLVPGNLVITTKSYNSFAAIGQPEPYTDVNHLGYYVVGDPFTDVNGNGKWDADQGAAGLGTAGDIVVYTVTYPWQITTPFLQNVLGKNGVFTLSSSAVVKNEPYTIGGAR